MVPTGTDVPAPADALSEILGRGPPTAPSSQPSDPAIRSDAPWLPFPLPLATCFDMADFGFLAFVLLADEAEV